MEETLHIIVEYTILLVNYIALIIILVGLFFSVKALILKEEKTPSIHIGESLNLGLRYLIVAEALHTFTSESFESLISLATLLAIRVLIGYFNEQELKLELEELEELEELDSLK